MRQADDLVGEESVACGGDPPARRLGGKAPGDLGAAGFEGMAEQVADVAVEIGAVGNQRDGVAYEAPVDDCAALLDQVEAVRGHPPTRRFSA